MKLGSLAWAGILLVGWMASSCRNTPANTPSAEATPQGTPTSIATAESSPVPAPNAAVAPTNAPGEADSHVTENVPTPTPPPPVILPVGTVLSVRLNDSVDTEKNKAGSKFSGAIGQAITQHGAVVIPAGSAVSGTVVQSEAGGKIKGGSSLSLQLSTVTVKRVSYPISTGPFLQEAKGKGSRTAKFGAGGGAAGAVIGGLAGGGKGALIGAAAGAGAGVAGSAFTGNKDLTIPTEAVLQFKLTQPLRLAPGGTQEPKSDSNE